MTARRKKPGLRRETLIIAFSVEIVASYGPRAVTMMKAILESVPQDKLLGLARKFKILGWSQP